MLKRAAQGRPHGGSDSGATTHRFDHAATRCLRGRRRFIGTTTPPPPPANLAPTFGVLTFQATEDTDLTARVPATDPEGAAVTITSTSNPAHGTLVSLAADGDLVYRPAANYSGDDTFAVRVVDPAGNAATGTVSISIAPVNDSPQAAAVTLQTDEDIQVQAALAGHDVETGRCVTSALANPANGLLRNVTAAGAFALFRTSDSWAPTYSSCASPTPAAQAWMFRSV